MRSLPPILATLEIQVPSPETINDIQFINYVPDVFFLSYMQ